jgi:hypothetical protein
MRGVFDLLAARACLAAERVRATTLSAYAGWLFETDAPYQKTKWLLSVGRPSRNGGQPFCPALLPPSLAGGLGERLRGTRPVVLGRLSSLPRTALSSAGIWVNNCRTA